MIFPQEQTHLFKTYLLQNLRLWRRPACQSLPKTMDISSATAQVALGPLKTLAILSDTTVTRFTVDRKDLKPHWKQKKGYTRLGDNRAVVFSSRHFPNILKNRDHQRNLPTIWKIRLLQTKVCEKVLAHSSLEPPLEYNQHQTTLTNQGLLRLFEPSWELQKYYAVSD